MQNQSLELEKIYADQEVLSSPLCVRVLAQFSSTPVEIVSDREDFLEKADRVSASEGKKILWLTQFKGPFLKPCPGTEEHYLCCRYWIVNAQTNCPLDCTYCVLQGYLNNPFFTLYTNLEGIPGEIDRLLEDHPGRVFRIGTGELTDSLVFDPWTGLSEMLIAHAQKKIYLLELKTKTDQIRHLPEIPKGRMVVAFSLNPREIIRTEEFKTAPVEERIKAAQEASRKGYRLAFHFDPILESQDWDTRYSALIRDLTSAIPEEEVTWISLGSLRFPAAFKPVIEKRFPKTTITSAEMVRGLDGKLRYFRPIRTKIYQKIYGAIRKQWKNVFVYFCMENRTVWNDVMGFSPENNAHTDFLFHENLSKRFPDMSLPPPSRSSYLIDTF